MKRNRIVIGVLLILLLLGGGIGAGYVFFQKNVNTENPDVYGRIYIPDTVIDYPVLQHKEDNGYYLTHDEAGNENASGAIFSESYNSRSFEDNLTVLYGNNMEDGSMFGSLRKYSDNLYMQEHPYIYVYADDTEYKYRVFAAYLSDNRHIMERFQSGKSSGNRMAYLNSIFENRVMGAQIDERVIVDENSKILTLSTHDEAGEEYRYLVQACLIEKNKVSRIEAEE